MEQGSGLMWVKRPTSLRSTQRYTPPSLRGIWRYHMVSIVKQLRFTRSKTDLTLPQAYVQLETKFPVPSTGTLPVE